MRPVQKSCLAAVAIVAGLCAASAHASDVHWSVGINAPIGPGVSVGTVISNRHYAPVIVAPAPVLLPAPVYVPPPVVYAPPPRVVYAPPVVYAPRPVVWGAPVWVDGRWVHSHRHAHGWYGHNDGRRGPPVYVPRHPGREIRY